MRTLISSSWMPIVTVLIVVAVYVPFGGDFTLLFFTVPLMFMLLSFFCLSGLFTFWQWQTHEKPTAASCLVAFGVALAGIPIVLTYAGPLRDPFWFLL